MNYDAAFKNIDDTLWKDAGCGSELDYIEQTSWILFLKYLDDLEKENKAAAELSNKTYAPILSNEFSWETWAAPKKADGSLDYNAAKNGDDLKDFVNTELFPYLKSFKSVANDANTLEYKIGQIFSELSNKLQSGYSLREVINKVNELQFLSNEEKHELSSLYEDKIKNMGNAGRNGGEYYTPRPLIQAITQVVNPVIGDKVYDGAVGSAGFLCEAYSHILNSKELTATEFQQLQTSTLYGKEKKSLAYVIGTMNMILHGIEAPNILHGNTLGENIADIQEKDRIDVVLANPPFGGKERAEVQQNFPVATSETAYLFLQHFIKMLKVGGRCGIVIKNTFLSNPDSASILLRKQLIEECNLHSILILPKGVFTGTPIETVVLFFEKGLPTKNIWYYMLNTERKITAKRNPLNQKHMSEFVKIFNTREITTNSWVVDVADINNNTFSLDFGNPNIFEEIDDRRPQEIINEIEVIDKKIIETFKSIKELL